MGKMKKLIFIFFTVTFNLIIAKLITDTIKSSGMEARSLFRI